MTPEKTKKAFETLGRLIKARTGYDSPHRMEPDQLIYLGERGGHYGTAMNHLLFCCEEGVRLVDQDRMEKAFRWLGFVQGAIWAAGLAPLDVLKKMNMPEPEEPDVWPKPDGSRP
jgi:hypothetical protein